MDVLPLMDWMAGAARPRLNSTRAALSGGYGLFNTNGLRLQSQAA
jgi:hypothetical protein